ncbi:hypothetical protein IE81DRAFT_166107 [Ceraceosorus guamensis]|uniref:Uncharacterized protein n=1 Tax=Ceraceosorus guamensis TaxID=1522189 RepID=A0A316W764_9BASI|nr:hypothetical protein IE81DRAFT_166107 [Ceraceosorus guamensis]PWN45689.1 hypothetical protein IE81DRAFT_166107 [Ceraceosorus guamensis]
MVHGQTLKQNLPQAFQSNGGRSATIRVLQPVRAEVPFKRTRSQDAGSRHPKLLLRRVATCRAFRQTRTVRRPATSRSRSRAPPSLALAVIPRRDSAAAIRNGLLAALRKRDHQAFPPSSFHLRLRRPRLGSEPSVRSSPPVAQHQEQDGGDIVDDLHSKQAPSHQNIVPNEPVRVRQTQCSSEDADADALPDRLEPLPTRRRGREPETRINNRDGAAFTGTSTNGDLDLTFRETNTNVSLPCAAAYASGQLVASPEAEADDQEDTVLLVEIELDEDQLSQCYPPAVDSAWEINLTNAEQAEVKDTILHIYADDDDIDYDAHGLHLQDPRCEGSTEDGECESEEVAMDIGELDGSIDLLDECILLLMDE